mmetsp:Transcript_3550/g.10333  ORF Transcript_3550/g.10333 Transcript_3550/m.10333 type:complete len:316 (-) Transcript_3550:2457-3404(-)
MMWRTPPPWSRLLLPWAWRRTAPMQTLRLWPTTSSAVGGRARSLSLAAARAAEAVARVARTGPGRRGARERTARRRPTRRCTATSPATATVPACSMMRRPRAAAGPAAKAVLMVEESPALLPRAARAAAAANHRRSMTKTRPWWPARQHLIPRSAAAAANQVAAAAQPVEAGTLTAEPTSLRMKTLARRAAVRRVARLQRPQVQSMRKRVLSRRQMTALEVTERMQTQSWARGAAAAACSRRREVASRLGAARPTSAMLRMKLTRIRTPRRRRRTWGWRRAPTRQTAPWTEPGMPLKRQVPPTAAVVVELEKHHQ